MEHKCPTTVLGCIDFRFWPKLVEYMQYQKDRERFDFISMAGGAKNLVDEDTRRVTFKELDVCVGQHEAEMLYLANHIDCGAYGGSAAFASPEAEREKLIADLQTARTIIAERYPQIMIKLLLHTFEGVEEIQ